MKKILGIVALIIFFASCKKPEPVVPPIEPIIPIVPVVPVVPVIATLSTAAISNLGINSVTTGGEITSDGGGPIIARGVCYSFKAKPTTANTIVSSGAGAGPFTATITKLDPNTTYHVRSFATNSVGTAYGSDISFTTLYPSTVSDVDGNTYHTIKIGTQVWMVENLATTKYRSGIKIFSGTSNASWNSNVSGAYCNYDGNTTVGKIYGMLYNWYAVTNPENLAPKGWHIPTEAEWNTMVITLGGEPVAGGGLKEGNFTHWNTPNTGANNSSGFKALPGGFRDNSSSLNPLKSFDGITKNGWWWSATDKGSGKAACLRLQYNDAITKKLVEPKEHGLSVRCIMD